MMLLTVIVILVLLCVTKVSLFASSRTGGGFIEIKETIPRFLKEIVERNGDDYDVPFDDLRDYFLFSGQSNSIGFTTNGQSIGNDETYWLRLMRLFSIAERIGTTSMWKQNLYDIIEEVHNSTENEGHGPTSVITHLRDEVVKLQELGLLDQMNQSLPLGHCSFLDFNETANASIDRSSGSKSTKWNANCGMSFGYELIFSKALEMNGVRRSFETVKVAHGGTRLYESWFPDSGLHWTLLQNSIRNRSGAGKNWMGFVWSQGEAEAMDDLGDPYSTYLGNLTYLIARVRAEMFSSSENEMWRCSEEIPVVVTKVGYWPNGHNAHRIRMAQQTFCDSDLMAACVSMNDTSRFYHYDASSFLIGGHRIAKAYHGLKKKQPNFICSQSSVEPSWTSTELSADSSWSPTKLPTPQISSQDLVSGPIMVGGTTTPKSAGVINGCFKHVIYAIILIIAVQ